jgi:hypothetical protein
MMAIDSCISSGIFLTPFHAPALFFLCQISGRKNFDCHYKAPKSGGRLASVPFSSFKQIDIQKVSYVNRFVGFWGYFG